MNDVSEKRDRFLRLREKRMGTTLKQLELIGNMANKNAYTYHSGEARAIVSELSDAVSEVSEKFGLRPPRSVLGSGAHPETKEERAAILLEVYRIGPKLDEILNQLADEDYDGAKKTVMQLMTM